MEELDGRPAGLREPADQGARVPGPAFRAVRGRHLAGLHRPGPRRHHSRQRFDAHPLDPRVAILAPAALGRDRERHALRVAAVIDVYWLGLFALLIGPIPARAGGTPPPP